MLVQVQTSKKKKGCVGLSLCSWFAKEVSNKITASVGKKACSGESFACHFVGFDAQNLSSITVPKGECSSGNSCFSCGRDNTSNLDFEATTECCSVDTGNVDNACLSSDASKKSKKVKSPKSKKVL